MSRKIKNYLKKKNNECMSVSDKNLIRDRFRNLCLKRCFNPMEKRKKYSLKYKNYQGGYVSTIVK